MSGARARLSRAGRAALGASNRASAAAAAAPRPYGAAGLLATYDEEGPALYLVEPSGIAHKYHGTAVSFAKRAGRQARAAAAAALAGAAGAAGRGSRER